MNSQYESIEINIDNQPLRVRAGTTILEAARQSNIYIPTLCDHKDLTPFGGCRLCIVEVEGMRGFPTACTTPATKGMIIRTNTIQLQSIRAEILQLLLSEHPGSCLICDEQDECRDFSGTIRKAEVTTGCRYCPNDGRCELADVVKMIGIKEINYPISYRYLPIEKEDPFYDRDYNLCILCGRCVRMCQEIRAANTLTFKQRGRRTLIGPAFERTHIEAGCEFCGACISVCPTGALSEKTSKWLGRAEREENTTCALCGIGCQLRLQIKDGEVVNVLPADDPLVNNNQLCVKGRFCIPELVNDYRRLKKPYMIHDGLKAEIPLEQAVAIAAEKLQACPPEQFGMIISPNCTNEDLYVAQKFARAVINSNHIDTMVRVYYGDSFAGYIELMKRAVSLEHLRQAEAILCIGLDARYGRSVVGVELRRSNKRGNKIITVNPRPHNLPIVADLWLKPPPGRELELIQSLVRLTEKEKSDTSAPEPSGGNAYAEIATAAEILLQASAPVILIGPDCFQYQNCPEMLAAIVKLADNIKAGIMPLPGQNNLYGSLLMGACPELLPGGVSVADKKRSGKLPAVRDNTSQDSSGSWNSSSLLAANGLKVLYLVGDYPSEKRPKCDFLIYQNIFPPGSSAAADLVLPSAAFTEIDGTFINGERRLQGVKKGVDSPPGVLPDWKILSLIAQKMGKQGFAYETVADVQREISGIIAEFADRPDISRNILPLKVDAKLFSPESKSHSAGRADKACPFLLQTTPIEHAYRGFPLSAYVEGLRRLLVENTLEINIDDALKMNLAAGDEVIVNGPEFEKKWPVRICPDQPPGILRITLPLGEMSGRSRYPVRIRKCDV